MIAHVRTAHSVIGPTRDRVRIATLGRRSAGMRVAKLLAMSPSQSSGTAPSPIDLDRMPRRDQEQA